MIRPALERGASVICDRYVDSSVAYQGVGRELGLERVLDLNLAAVGGLLPDRTFLLELDPSEVAGAHPAATRPARARGRRLPRARRRRLPRARRALPRADRRPRRDAAAGRARRGGVWSPSRPFLSSPRRSGSSTAALAEGGAHAYLLHGPAGVGKRTAAFAFAAALLGDERRVASRSHPDLYLLEPLGEMIRIDDVRALRHDLHMRPFEGDRRVYLVLDADRMNEEAADALLKDLEEPPPYAVIVLVAGELGPLPPTILSRCQLVPFRRLSERAVREWIAAQAPERSEEEVRVARARVGGAARPRAPAARPGRGRAPRRADRRGALRLPRRRLRPGRRRRRPARRGRRARRGGAGARAGARRHARPSGARRGAARARRAARGRAGRAARRARGARGVVPRSRRRRRPAPRTRPSTRTASTTCARTPRRARRTARSAPPRRCGRRGARSRSST